MLLSLVFAVSEKKDPKTCSSQDFCSASHGFFLAWPEVADVRIQGSGSRSAEGRRGLEAISNFWRVKSQTK